MLYKKCIYLSNYILLHCKDILSKEDIIFINNKNDISDNLKEELYNNCVTNIINKQLIHNGKTTKENINKYISILNTDDNAKNIAIHNLNGIIDRYKKS